MALRRCLDEHFIYFQFHSLVFSLLSVCGGLVVKPLFSRNVKVASLRDVERVVHAGSVTLTGFPAEGLVGPFSFLNVALASAAVALFRNKVISIMFLSYLQ